MEIERDDGGMALRVTLLKPADMHQHVRRGNMTRLVMPMIRERFASAIIMPNTVPPITTARMVDEYRTEVIRALTDVDELTESFGPVFRPLMTLYFTDTLDPQEVMASMLDGAVGVKYYPPGLTTHSEAGVTNPSSLWTKGSNAYEVLEMLGIMKGTLLLHAADALDKDGRELDPYDQEPHFIRETLPRIVDAHPCLRISVEHLSTKTGAQFMWKNGGERLGCSLTPQHLLLDRRDLFRGGFNPHRFWIPIFQSSEDRDALRDLAAEFFPFVWLGSDSAPHPISDKQTGCCKGGVLTAHAAVELYLEAFEQLGVFDERFEQFASLNGPRFYGIEPSTETITLVRDEWTVRDFFYTDENIDPSITVHPFRLGEKVRWKLE